MAMAIDSYLDALMPCMGAQSLLTNAPSRVGNLGNEATHPPV